MQMIKRGCTEWTSALGRWWRAPGGGRINFTGAAFVEVMSGSKSCCAAKYDGPWSACLAVVIPGR